MLKKSILLLFSFVFMASVFAGVNQMYPDYDLAPGIIPQPAQPTDPQWDLQYEFNAEGPSGDNGCLGIAYDGTYAWVSGRGVAPNPNMIYLFDPISGAVMDQFPSGSASSWGCRDLCFDGTFMYSGWEQGMIQWNITTHAVITTIPFPGGMSFQRANAYDPATDHFYGGNFGSTCYEQDRSGTLIRSWSPAPLTAVYGMAWDDDDPAGDFLWVHDQGDGCFAHQLDPVTLTYTGVISGNLQPPIVGNAVGYLYALAGGLDYCSGIDPQFTSMLSFCQGTPDGAGIWEMHPDQPPPPHDVTVVLDPIGIIQIPAGGGNFEFVIAVTNNETSSVTCDVWTTATLPNTHVAGPLIGPVTVTISPLVSISRNRTQYVPAYAPTGDYTYDAYVGLYPGTVWDEDHFDFEKLAVDNGGPIVHEWANWGEGFDNPIGEAAVTPDEYALLNAYPNPFNPSATIAYDLKEAANVKLVVYDITGRAVATLVDGWMNEGAHQAVFTADNLSSGVYFYNLTAPGFSDTKKMLLIK